MKKLKSAAVLLLAMMVVSMPLFSADTCHATAKSSNPAGVTGMMRVNVPFAFSVGNNTLEAGEYYISPNGEHWITIKDAAAKTAIVVMTHNANLGNALAEPKLVFHRYGDKNFLAQVWLHYSNDGREISKSRNEAKLAREYRQQVAISQVAQ